MNIYSYYRNENKYLNFSTKSASSFPRVKWISQRQKEINAYENLDNQINQSKCVYLSCKQHNNNFKTFKINFIINLGK